LALVFIWPCDWAHPLAPPDARCFVWEMGMEKIIYCLKFGKERELTNDHTILTGEDLTMLAQIF
jgi:hypothetical protein